MEQQKTATATTRLHSIVMRIPDWMLDVTHCVRFSPNCNKQFEVRLVGKGAARLDLNLNNETRDRIGYGNTLAEAAENARSA